MMMMFEREVCSFGCFDAYFNDIEIVGKIYPGTNALRVYLRYCSYISQQNHLILQFFSRVVHSMLLFRPTVQHSYATKGFIMKDL